MRALFRQITWLRKQAVLAFLIAMSIEPTQASSMRVIAAAGAAIMLIWVLIRSSMDHALHDPLLICFFARVSRGDLTRTLARRERAHIDHAV